MKRLLGNGTKRLTVGQARAGHFFQDCLAGGGLTTTKPIGLPCNNQPFWFRARDRLANYRWAPALPASADVVVIGAGLTGASTAYHLPMRSGPQASASWFSIRATPQAKRAAATAATSS